MKDVLQVTFFTFLIDTYKKYKYNTMGIFYYTETMLTLDRDYLNTLILKIRKIMLTYYLCMFDFCFLIQTFFLYFCLK